MSLHRIAKAAAVLLLLASPTTAEPTGEQVVLGDVTFHRDGSVTVIHASDGSVIHYDSFDIFAHETVQFIQPGEQARVLNRVTNDAIDIDGTLLANGIVYLVSPVGVFIGGEAVVDAAGLVAAAGHISNEDFLAGVDRFELTGPVENASSEVRGDSVALLGTHVGNPGEIRAPEGTIALVAGDRVVLARLDGRVHVEVDGGPGEAGSTGVRQAGLVDAGGGQAILAAGDHYSLAINHEGVTRGADVRLQGGDAGVVLVQGELDASSRQGEGGAISVTGDRVALLGARLDASGASGGGDIRVGGDVRGEGDLPTARRVFVDAASELVADATAAGDGGSVVVWAGEAAAMDGAISARGGAAGGAGGFAEISSLGFLDADGEVDLGADAGEAGTLLFDPQDIVIMGGTADGSDDPDPDDDVLNDGTLGRVLFGDASDLPEPFLIFESEIEQTDANLRLEARNSISVSGAFDHEVAGEGPGVVVVTPGRSLAMETRNDTDDELGSAFTPGVDLGTLAWRTTGGNFTIVTGGTGATADIAVGDVSTAGGSVQLTATNGSVGAGDIDASGADGTGAANGTASGGVGVRVFGAGSIAVGDIAATGGDAAPGGSGNGGEGGAVRLTTDDGDLAVGAIDASGGDAGLATGSAGEAGAVALAAGLVSATSTGSITLNGALRAEDGTGTPGPFDSFGVSLEARDAVEFVGVTGPHITTTEALTLRGDTVGAVTPIEVAGDGTLDKALSVRTTDLAQVDVTTPGFFGFDMIADGNDADLHVTQVAEKAGGNGVTIDIVGAPGENTIQRIDTTQIDADDADTVGTRVDVAYQLLDDLTGDDDVDLQAVVASGAITAGGGVAILVEDDLVLEDGAIAIHEVLDPAAPMADDAGTGIAGLLQIGADDDIDGDGAILAGGSGTAIDMDPDGAGTTSQVLLVAGSGIGAPGAPIVMENADELGAGTRASGGVHVHHTAGGDLALAPLPFDPTNPRFAPFQLRDAIVVADAATGDIDVRNDAGDMIVRGNVRAAGDGTTGGGSIALGVTDADAVIRFRTSGGNVVDASGDVTLDGDVEIGTNAAFAAGGDIDFTGAIDTDSELLVPRDVAIESDGVVRFGGDVGGQRPLRTLAVAGAVELAQDTTLRTVFETRLADVDAAADDAAALTVIAGSTVVGGNLGANRRLRGVSIDSDRIVFDAAGDQTVEAGADGIALDPAGLPAVQPRSNIGKLGGDLDLETTGTLDVGANNKLTVDGTARLAGATVIVGDVSAQAIEVQSGDFQIRTRDSGPFQLPGGDIATDGGTDLIADTISTTSAPVPIGGGNTPQFATVSGAVDGAGAGSARVLRLDAPVESADLVNASNPTSPVFFDLGLPILDPDHETPEPPPVVELEEVRPGDEAAGVSARAPDADAVLAFLRCAEEQGPGSARACAPAPGSPLDSERGDEIAQRHARLFGASAEAQAARRLLAGDPDATGRGTVLRDLVALLAQIRLLGIDAEGYARVRDRLLDDAGAGRERLQADIRSQARGIPL
jgi:filamentous hemagglutinin family protein